MSSIPNENVVRFMEEHPGLQLIFSTDDRICCVETATGTTFEYNVVSVSNVSVSNVSVSKRKCADCGEMAEYLTENDHCQECVKYP